jgi:hypothetical protein
MSHSNGPGTARPLPPGRYAVQILARNDPAPSGRFAVEHVGTRNLDDPVQAEFAVCIHLDLLQRELRTNDRVHVMQRYRGGLRHLIRRVETKGDVVLLYPVKTGRGAKAEPIDAASVAIVGLVTGGYTEYRA